MVIRIVQKLDLDKVDMTNKYIESLAANSDPDKLLIDAFKTIELLTDELTKSEKLVDKLKARNSTLVEAIASRDCKIENRDAEIESIVNELERLVRTIHDCKR